MRKFNKPEGKSWKRHYSKTEFKIGLHIQFSTPPPHPMVVSAISLQIQGHHRPKADFGYDFFFK